MVSWHLLAPYLALKQYLLRVVQRMENKERIIWWLILILLLISTIGVITRHLMQPKNVSVTYDTITVYDTIIYPIPCDSIIKRYETVKLPVTNTEVRTDTIYKIDSVEVSVPISQKTYSDSTYKAVISGFHISLDSIIVRNREITKTITETRYKPTRWGLGVSAGYDPINNSVGITLGVQYNILPLK